MMIVISALLMLVLIYARDYWLKFIASLAFTAYWVHQALDDSHSTFSTFIVGWSAAWTLVIFFAALAQDAERKKNEQG